MKRRREVTETQKAPVLIPYLFDGLCSNPLKDGAKIDDFPPDQQEAELKEVRRNLAASDDPDTIQRIHNIEL